MRVSVCIIAKNEPKIRYTLESLAQQTLKPHEIIVVVDEPNDLSAEIAKNFTSELPIKIIINDVPGYGGARKRCVDTATGNIITFIDADCVADGRWIENLIRKFSQKDVMAQAGRIIEVKSLAQIADMLKYANVEKYDEESIISFATTMNFAFRRELIDLIGNFDPWFRDGGEDLDFCVRILKAGYKIYYNPSAIVYHVRHRYSLRKAWRDGESRARAFIKHKTALLKDATVCFFHFGSLVTAVALLAMGNYLIGLLVLIPSIAHRMYRLLIDLKHGSTVIAGISRLMLSYVSYTSFTMTLISYMIKLVTNKVKGLKTLS